MRKSLLPADSIQSSPARSLLSLDKIAAIASPMRNRFMQQKGTVLFPVGSPARASPEVRSENSPSLVLSSITFCPPPSLPHHCSKLLPPASPRSPQRYTFPPPPNIPMTPTIQRSIPAPPPPPPPTPASIPAQGVQVIECAQAPLDLLALPVASTADVTENGPES